MGQRKTLNEISLIRPVLILLLVLFHSFAPWTGSWKLFSGFEQNKVYWWIGQFAYSFMLPTFTFISGYIWAFQRETLNRKDSLLHLCRKKFMRLYIPSIVFSFFYVILYKFPPPTQVSDIWFDYILSILNGTGHMWFLPMLFWCFILCQLLLMIPNALFRIIIVLLLALFNVISLPLQMKQSCFYLIYFYLGYELWIFKGEVKKFTTKQYVSCMWILFIIFFVVLINVKEYFHEYFCNIHGFFKLFGVGIVNLCHIVYSFLGIMAMYITAVFYTNDKTLPKYIYEIGTLCFGVYLYQQFILQYLYYYTNLPILIGNEMLPWIGFAITLLCSVFLSYITRKTKFGRKLI